MHSSKNVRQERRERMWRRRGNGEMFWRASSERNKDGGERCGCLCETMGVGHSFTDSSTLARFLWETTPQLPSPYLPTISGTSCWSEGGVEIALRTSIPPWGACTGARAKLGLEGTPTVAASSPELRGHRYCFIQSHAEEKVSRSVTKANNLNSELNQETWRSLPV